MNDTNEQLGRFISKEWMIIDIVSMAAVSGSWRLWERNMQIKLMEKY